MKLAFSVIIYLVAAAGVVITLLPEWRTNLWWVRAMDIPRLQVAVILALLLMPLCFVQGPRWIVVIAVVLALFWQGVKIFPFTPLAGQEVQLADSAPEDITILAANVLMENRDYETMRRLIDETVPDILLLMETDQAWLEAMEPVLSRFETVLREPKDNHYGLIFATSLPSSEARVVYLTPSETPSVISQMTAPSGNEFRFVGLHPRPPVPGESTEQRDAQIMYAARFGQSSDLPLLAMGDFNAAAWSHTTQHFKEVGEFLDPRVGRGLYSSFDANSRLLRAPIDQLYVTPNIAVVDFRRGPHIGSDHFPMIAHVRIDADLAARLNRIPPSLTDKRLREIEDRVEKYEAWLKEERAKSSSET